MIPFPVHRPYSQYTTYEKTSNQPILSSSCTTISQERTLMYSSCKCLTTPARQPSLVSVRALSVPRMSSKDQIENNVKKYICYYQVSSGFSLYRSVTNALQIEDICQSFSSSWIPRFNVYYFIIPLERRDPQTSKAAQQYSMTGLLLAIRSQLL